MGSVKVVIHARPVFMVITPVWFSSNHSRSNEYFEERDF
jgi:hypothetical protein